MSSFLYHKVKKSNALFFAAFLAVFLTWGIKVVFAEVKFFQAAKDASVVASKHDYYFGETKFLTVLEKDFSLGEGYALVQFDFSSVPKKSTIVSATIRFFVNSFDGEEMDVALYRNLTDWKENTVSWSSKPNAVKNPSARLRIDKSFAGKFIDIDVKGDVAGFLAEEFKNFGWTIKSERSGSGGVNFSSKEDLVLEKSPLLIIKYDGASGAGKNPTEDGLAVENDILKENPTTNKDNSFAGKENEKAASSFGEGSAWKLNWKEGILMTVIFGIFLTMFFILSKKDKEEAEL